LINNKFKNWFKGQKKINKINIDIIDISKINNWKADKVSIFHISKKFFKIIGIKVNTNFFKKNWDQPIILQNELGILGLIKNFENGKYLLQAKVEPGNKNKLQLSPTVQATKSNFTQIHGGKKVPYLNFFLKQIKKNKTSPWFLLGFFKRINWHVQLKKLIKYGHIVCHINSC